MLWTIFVIMLVPWLPGFSFHITGGMTQMIHLLLIVAVAALVFYLVNEQRRECKRPAPATRNSELPRI